MRLSRILTFGFIFLFSILSHAQFEITINTQVFSGVDENISNSLVELNIYHFFIAFKEDGYHTKALHFETANHNNEWALIMAGESVPSEIYEHIPEYFSEEKVIFASENANGAWDKWFEISDNLRKIKENNNYNLYDFNCGIAAKIAIEDAKLIWPEEFSNINYMHLSREIKNIAKSLNNIIDEVNNIFVKNGLVIDNKKVEEITTNVVNTATNIFESASQVTGKDCTIF
jgi:hypothetical protein